MLNSLLINNTNLHENKNGSWSITWCINISQAYHRSECNDKNPWECNTGQTLSCSWKTETRPGMCTWQKWFEMDSNNSQELLLVEIVFRLGEGEDVCRTCKGLEFMMHFKTIEKRLKTETKNVGSIFLHKISCPWGQWIWKAFCFQWESGTWWNGKNVDQLELLNTLKLKLVPLCSLFISVCWSLTSWRSRCTMLPKGVKQSIHGSLVLRCSTPNLETTQTTL